MVEQTGSSFRISIFGKALEASNTCNLLGICIVRAIPRTSKNGSTFCQKSHQNPGLGAPKSMSGGVWGRLGSVLSHLGPSWTFLEASWSVLEASWRRLGNLLGRFGPKKVAEMAPSWLRKRYQNLKKTISKSISCSMPLGITICRFSSDFWNQKPNYVGSKIL